MQQQNCIAVKLFLVKQLLCIFSFREHIERQNNTLGNPLWREMVRDVLSRKRPNTYTLSSTFHGRCYSHFVGKVEPFPFWHRLNLWNWEKDVMGKEHLIKILQLLTLSSTGIDKKKLCLNTLTTAQESSLLYELSLAPNCLQVHKAV